MLQYTKHLYTRRITTGSYSVPCRNGPKCPLEERRGKRNVSKSILPIVSFFKSKMLSCCCLLLAACNGADQSKVWTKHSNKNLVNKRSTSCYLPAPPVSWTSSTWLAVESCNLGSTFGLWQLADVSLAFYSHYISADECGTEALATNNHDKNQDHDHDQVNNKSLPNGKEVETNLWKSSISIPTAGHSTNLTRI